MKKLIIVIIALIISSYIHAQEFEIIKIDEITYSQEFADAEDIQIIDNYLYALNMNGLEIYEIYGDGSITKISMLIIAEPRNMLIKDQYCFIGSGGNRSPYIIPDYYIKINKIDISDVYNPIVLDQVEYPELDMYFGIFKLGNYMVMKWFDSGSGFYDDFYSIPEMEYIGQIVSDNYYNIINDSLLVRQDGHIITTVQYNPPNEFEIIGTTNVSAYSDGNYRFDHFKVKNDTILSAVNSKNITFWDISNVANWQYISRYTLPEGVYMPGNKQYTVMDDNVVIFFSGSLQLLDISDISNPILVDSIEHNMLGYGQGCDHFENDLYVGTINDGIQYYSIANNTVEYNESYYDHIRFYIGDMYDNKIIMSTFPLEGYYLFDIEDPLNPIDLGDWFFEKRYQLIHKTGGWMVLKDFEELRIEFYDIADLENPILRNTLSLNIYDLVMSFPYIDESDPISIYLYNLQTNMFSKFDISEPGEAIEQFEYLLPSFPEGLAIINSKAYGTVGSSPYDLLIIGGLEENEPFIENEITDFTDNQYVDGQDGYLLTRGSVSNGDIAQIFQLDNPLQPELYFTPQWGNRIEIHDELIFARIEYIVAVYENRPNCTEPMAIFNGLNYIYNIDLMEHAGTNYLITLEMADIGLFEYTYIPSSAEDELLKPVVSLSNYPNPFNPETNIVFNLPEEGEVQLEIYNVKGQKVIQLVSDQLLAGEHSIVWDGEDASGKDVCSGLYLYKLNINGKTEIVKKCMLLK